MSAITIIQLTPDEFEARIGKAMDLAIERAAERSGETWRAAELATRM